MSAQTIPDDFPMQPDPVPEPEEVPYGAGDPTLLPGGGKVPVDGPAFE